MDMARLARIVYRHARQLGVCCGLRIDAPVWGARLRPNLLVSRRMVRRRTRFADGVLATGGA
jgi:hypothetical protein